MTDKPITVEPMPNFTNEHTLGCWLIQGPFHIAWNQWTASLVHLRGEKDGKPANFQFPGATHEFLIMAISPNDPIQADHDPDVAVQYLTPIDVCQQFIAENDAEALEKIEHLLEHVRRGELSPDQDYRSHWRMRLRPEEGAN